VWTINKYNWDKKLWISVYCTLSSERIRFPKNNLTGEWKTTIVIEKTSYNPFKDLRKIEYKLHLIQKGYELSGSGESKRHKPDGTETVFIRVENRVNSDVDGYFERCYLGKSKVYFKHKWRR